MNVRILSCCLLLCAATGALAQTVLVPMALKRSEAQAVTAESSVLLEEDFSKMSAGSESTPDGTYIADKRTGAIPASYTKTPGWSGAAIYQAGGACAILTGKYSDGNGGYIEDTGFLRTPQGAYAGDVTLTFRAKLYDSAKTSDIMALTLMNSTSALERTTADITPQWKDYTVSFSRGEFSGCLIQMSMSTEKVLVDDIKVTAVQTSIPAPVALPATNFTADGFTANWESSAQADSYLLTVYEKKVEEAITIEDFDNLNIIAGTNKLDKNDPGFTEGWTVVYGNTRNADHVSPDGYEGSTGMIFRAKGEGFVTPVFDRPILDFSFFASHPSGEPCFSRLVVSVLVDDAWINLGNYDVERIPAEGNIIRLSSNLPEGVRSIQVYFNKDEINDAGKDVSIVIDHIRIMTDPEPVAVMTDGAVAGLSVVVTGIDAEKDYSYTVKAVNDMFTSAESNEITALGLIPPHLLGGTEIGSDSYTARWEATPKADGYHVCNYLVYTVQQDQEEVEILSEDFEKVTEGSLEAPVGLYNMVNPLALDAYTTNPGWYGIATYLARGMIGTRSYMGIQGIIQTPALDLSANNGNFTVKVRVIGDSDATDEYLVVQAGMVSYSSQPIKAGEMVELTYNFSAGTSGMPLALYSYNGYPFYIDQIIVTQTLPKGTEVFTEVENRSIEGIDNLSATFSGLAAAPAEHYAYRVFAYRDFMGSRIYSLSDDVAHVGLTSGIEAIETPDQSEAARYYRIDGVEVGHKPTAPGIYIRRTGTKAEKIIVTAR